MKHLTLFLFFFGSVLSAQTQTNWLTQIGNKPFYDNRQYNFQAITPGGTLTGGTSHTSVLPVCPQGMNGTDTNHYVYISGGTGTAEAPLITGGTCTPGLANGTIIFTPANTHSGAWTITSASTGIKEALIACAAAFTTGGSQVMVVGGAGIYALLDISNNCALQGQGTDLSYLNCTMTSRCIQWVGASYNAAFINVSNFSIIYSTPGTSGEALYVQDCANGNITDLVISGSYVMPPAPVNGPYDAMTLENVAHLFVQNIYGTPLHNGFNVGSNSLDTSVTTGSYPQINNVHLILQANVGAGLNLSSSLTGPQFTNMVIEQGAYCVLANDSLGYAVNEGVFQGTCDNYGTGGIYFILSGGSYAYRWNIHDSLINGTGFGVTFSSPVANTFKDTTVANNTIGYSASQGVGFVNATGVKITDNTIFSNTSANVGSAIIFLAGPVTNAIISGNQIGGGSFSAVGTSTYDISLDAQAHAGIYIGANHFYTAASAAIQDLHTGGGLVEWDKNMGIDDVIPSVSSATAFALPINPTVIITGTTTVTSFTGPVWTGRTVRILYPTGAGVTILGHATGAAPQSLTFTYNGSAWN